MHHQYYDENQAVNEVENKVMKYRAEVLDSNFLEWSA